MFLIQKKIIDCIVSKVSFYKCIVIINDKRDYN